MARKLWLHSQGLLARLRAEERGFGLIEVMVSAVLVALIGIGVFTGLDAASATSGQNKARSIATHVAQDDQERLRSFRVGELSNLNETRTVNVAGVPYTVVSRATWVSDGSGSQSCTNSSNEASYLRIRSSVSWPSIGTAKPVSLTSLVAPPNGSFAANEGSLVVQVRDRLGVGIQGVSVSASGPTSLSDTTDESGCAFFGYVATGTYTVSLGQAGYVDSQGGAAPSRQATVIGEETATVAFDYDQAASATVSFNTSVGGTVRAAQAEYVTLAHSGLQAPGTRIFGTGTSAASIPAGSLFPFPSPYAIFSGNCSGADPRNYGQAAGLLTAGPGGSYAITVREPAIRIRVRKNLVNLNNARVRLTPKSTGCAGVLTRSTNSSGAMPEPGFPYGTYDVCADDNLGASSRRVTRTNVVNTNPAGTSVLTFDILTTNPITGPCP
jgi:type II secretory pathway pseudopilin PulG